jgi:ABC-2 type transport system permease protein
MRRALHAEWTKMRTVAGPGWLLLATVAATIALSAGATSLTICDPAGCGGDMTKLSLAGVRLGQATAAILAVLIISGEYSSGMIRTTLAAIPRRSSMFAAKALTLTGVVAVAGAVAVLGSLLAGRLILPAFSPADGPTLRAAAGSVVYLALIALLGLGIAAVVRDSATSIGVILGLLYLPSILSPTISDPNWQRLLEQIAPMNAGLAIQATTDLHHLPVSPWAGLGVTAGWAIAALVAGGLSIRIRDA